MTGATAFFVQFPHPGVEHRTVLDVMPWNVGNHRRKFVRSAGRYVDQYGELLAGDLTFWGEWEPPSRVERRWPRDGQLPRTLHIPYWTRETGVGPRQNTDPWVWGEQMLYSNCKQTVGPQRRATSMQRLTPGSVICFGSTIAAEFCIDTVFVVASREPWVAGRSDDLDTTDAFKVCTGQSLATSARDAEMHLTLYRSATFDDPVEGMFSFLPARLADAVDARFARPRVRLPGLINPANRQSTWGSKRPLPIDLVRDAWDSIRDQVVAQGLHLGTRIGIPPEVG